METEPLFQVVQSIVHSNCRFEILQYREIAHHDSWNTQQLGNRLQQVRVILQEGKITSTEDLFYYSKGKIELNLEKRSTEQVKKIKRRFLPNHATLQPTYEGTGEIYFRPEWEHYLIFQLDKNEILVDQHMFICGESSLQLSYADPKNINQAVNRNREKLQQLKLKGSGVCVLRSPVPVDEIVQIDLQDETFRTEEDIVIYRQPSVEFTIEGTDSSKMFSNIRAADSFLRAYRGTGTIWITPTRFLHQEDDEEEEEE
ncbi:Uncharacterized conserved protein, AIM24 family [Seinonella peptonophila]|uniref:Uncharacterized conserved protein, AIM24 family n=1 Tax=Seinonella peptonophila TaxID=112248 RepID=A0A1M4TPL0_9BACL|nr:AIM24 family protein [Seinonella peptonophila]SHE46430.1 Uncharacterized conserved protein, AIM24 family [Seinonella peptonophila]